jgi:ankyrin repeat protein
MGNIEFARMLLERGALIDVRGYYGRTALHHAAMKNKVQIARLLLEHGADVDARDEYGNTPSQFVSRDGHPEIVELLSGYRAKSVTK